MADENTKADALDIGVLGELNTLMVRHIGTISGVEPVYVSERNGLGNGRIRWDAQRGALQWRAPDSSAYGEPVYPSADSTHLLMDGEDENAYVVVDVHVDYLSESGEDAKLEIAERHIEGIDVTAAKAASGNSSAWYIRLTNASSHRISNLKVWLTPGTTFLGMSLAILGPYTQPMSEGEALEIGDMGPGDSEYVYIQRTIPAGTASSPRVMVGIEHTWDGV